MPKQQSAQPATASAAEYSAEAIIGSVCHCQCSRIHGRINNRLSLSLRYSRIHSRSNNRLSLSLPIQQNTGLSRYTYTFHNASQRRGQEGKSARRGDGLRNYECFPFSQITHFQKVKTIIQKNQTIQFPLTSKSENYNPKNQTIQFPHTSKSENYNPKKSNYPIYLTSKSENYNLKNQTTQFPLT